MDLVGVAGLITAVGGFIATIAAVRRSKTEGVQQGTAQGKHDADQDCHERLMKMQEESERIAAQLHKLRMERIE